MFELDPINYGYYVLLLNIYAKVLGTSGDRILKYVVIVNPNREMILNEKLRNYRELMRAEKLFDKTLERVKI